MSYLSPKEYLIELKKEVELQDKLFERAKQRQKKTVTPIEEGSIGSSPSIPQTDSNVKKIEDVLDTKELQPIIPKNLPTDDVYVYYKYIVDHVNGLIKKARWMPRVFSSITQMKRGNDLLTQNEKYVFDVIMRINTTMRSGDVIDDADEYATYEIDDEIIDGIITDCKKIIIPYFDKAQNPLEKDGNFKAINANDQLIAAQKTFQDFTIESLPTEDEVAIFLGNIVDRYDTLLELEKTNPKVATLVNASIWYIEKVI